MRKIITIAVLAMVSFANAQAFKGKGDVKGQVGMTMQDGGTGIGVSADFGMGENMSFGIVAGYMLNANDKVGFKPRFEDRADLKVRFNANIGNVLKLDPKMDVYPGLDLGLRNFGGHLGFRYFFTNGFGMFAEANAPLARYDTDVNGFEHYNNQFVFTIGASFNL
ncbi:hypothetical protein IVB69_07770 [Flavobacterium sp. J49]|uniref:DUF6646 family protein n=1 Tax=Flavobacterium sp. J49 TaxID=2718534 RepID=UPI00159306E3|nr:DUF6646 family protein [Flavobacterium sp. J49]MBF6641374.1 hypothetical protein [Flavobacterium sp. J49]NIC02621.1 hypothetical protein [Flavobacterium sp. J49]